VLKSLNKIGSYWLNESGIEYNDKFYPSPLQNSRKIWYIFRRKLRGKGVKDRARGGIIARMHLLYFCNIKTF
jgi:hypothetical protein